MASTAGDLACQNLRVAGTASLPDNCISGANVAPNAAIERSKMEREDLAKFPVPLTSLREWDAFATNLPAAATSTYLGLVGGSFGAASPVVQAGDIGGASSTRRARFLVPLPLEYDAGQSLTLRLRSAMVTTVCDGHCNVDAEIYKCNRDGGIGSDICLSAAQSMNSLTPAEKDFVIDPTGLEPGDVLDVRVSIDYADAGDAGVMIPQIGAIELLADVKG